MILSVTKIFEFEAAHYLPGYPGDCKNLHGHSYKLEVEYGVTHAEFCESISKPNDPYDDAMIMDFVAIKKEVKKKILQQLDHQNLNEVNYNGFPYWMPTAENMVLWIYEQLKNSFRPIQLLRVRLWETSTSYAEMRR